MGKTGNDKPGFSFAKLSEADNYKKWAREMGYSLESAGLWDHTLEDEENSKPAPKISTSKNLENDVKAKWQEKRMDKIQALTKDSLKCKR